MKVARVEAVRDPPADARVLHRVVEGAAGVVEDLTHIDAAGDEVGAGGGEVVPRTTPHYRNDLKPARISSERNFGCSHAAK